MLKGNIYGELTGCFDNYGAYFIMFIICQLAFPADIGRKPATLTRRQEQDLPVRRTRRLMKRPTAYHMKGGGYSGLSKDSQSQ